METTTIMNQVFEKTRELGELITQTTVFTKMRAAEERVIDDASASVALDALSEHQTALEHLFASGEPDAEVIKQHTETMQKLQARLKEMPIVADMNRAREEFSGLIRQVNQVLGFVVSGDMMQSGCGGGCEGCAGGCNT